MRASFRHTVFATTAVIGLSGFAAVAAPPSTVSSAATTPTATAGPSATTQPAGVHSMAGKTEQRITDLHARLHISPAQQAQWDQFSQVMRDSAHSMDETFQHRMQAISTMTATQNMQSYAEVATDHAQEAQRLVPAFQALYDTMSATQKQMADQVFRDDAHHGGRPRHG